MSKKRDRTVYQEPDGTWADKRNDASEATSVHTTHAGAVAAARAGRKKQGGGELTTKGRSGEIRSEDAIAPGHDPYLPEDREPWRSTDPPDPDHDRDANCVPIVVRIRLRGCGCTPLTLQCTGGSTVAP